MTPLYAENLEFVLEQLSAIYQDLIKALQIMRITTDNKDGATTLAMSKSKIFYAMFLLENKQLHLGFNINVNIFEYQKFCLFSLFFVASKFLYKNRRDNTRN